MTTKRKTKKTKRITAKRKATKRKAKKAAKPRKLRRSTVVPFAVQNYVFPEIRIEGPLDRSQGDDEREEIDVCDNADVELILPGIDVLTLGTLTPAQAVRLFGGMTLFDGKNKLIEPPRRPITCYLSYPLSRSARVVIPPYKHFGRSRMYADWILWALAHAYQAIYAHADAYGVWGHCIGDLVFEKLWVKGTKAYVGIGS